MMAFQSTIIFHFWLSWKGRIPTQKIATMIVLKTVVGMGWLATYLYLIQTNIHKTFFLGHFCIWIANWCMSRWYRTWNGLPPQLSLDCAQNFLVMHKALFLDGNEKTKISEELLFPCYFFILDMPLSLQASLDPKTIYMYVCKYEYLLPPSLFICL